MVTPEVQAELDPQFPSAEAPINWINTNRVAGTILQPGPAPSYAFSNTQDDIGEQSIAWYISGGFDTRTGDRLIPINSAFTPTSVQVLHEDPSGMATYVQPALRLTFPDSPPPQTTTGYLSNLVLSGEMSYGLAAGHWRQTVTAPFLQLNDPTTTDPSGINIFGASALGNAGPDREIGSATISWPGVPGATITFLGIDLQTSQVDDIQFFHPAYVLPPNSTNPLLVSADASALMTVQSFGAIIMSGKTIVNDLEIPASSSTVLFGHGGIVSTRLGGVPVKINLFPESNGASTYKIEFFDHVTGERSDLLVTLNLDDGRLLLLDRRTYFAENGYVTTS